MLVRLSLLIAVALAGAEARESAETYLGDRMPYAAFDRLPATRIEVGGGEIVVGIAPGSLTMPRPRLLAWIEQCAGVVTAYYGRFPARRTRLLVVPRAGGGVSGGKAWGHGGAAVRITVGEHATEAELARDWVLIHEMVHLAFPSVAARHHWIEEGLATYVEPVARAQAGRLDPRVVWAELADGLPKGLPRAGDRGLDHTPTWGRTYWGGALFALLADVEIRRQTRNRVGLADALRAILAFGNIETSAPLAPLLEIGDRATGVRVLTELYERMKDRPEPVDLHALWGELGVRLSDGAARLDDAAPLAAARRAITAPSTISSPPGGGS
ncbi:MAG TPA: hypothetical protein VJU81_18430 [Methylomirabilota bacterium]|nr:hypothetical protein [Methylomirabilota bacterium]